MIAPADLLSEVLDLAKALGLIDDAGSLDAGWFEAPLARVSAILSNAPQREALLRLLDAVVPAVDGLVPDEKWHPLLGAQPRGNVFLSTQPADGSVALGLAAAVSSVGTGPGSATLTARLPLVQVSASGVQSIAGTAAGPLSVSLTVRLGWTRGAQPISLDSVTVALTLAPLAAGGSLESIVVTLNGLDVDGTGPRDAVLDPNHLEHDAVTLVLGLLRERLGRTTPSTGEVAAVVDHLLALLGFDGSGLIPPLPLAAMAQSPTALRDWFTSMSTGQAPPIVLWLGHFGGLLGATNQAILGSGSVTDPWRLRTLSLDSTGASGVDVTLAVANGSGPRSLLFGASLQLAPAVASPAARVEAAATFAAIPFAGVGAAVVLPDVSITLVAPGANKVALLSATAISVGSLRAGLRWTGEAVVPLLELIAVTMDASSYPRIDLTDANSVAAAAGNSVRAAIVSAIGSGGTAQHLAALAGLIAPTDDPASPHVVDVAALAANPARAMGAVHRAVLADLAHTWSHVLLDLAGLLGLPGPATGSGSQADPWAVVVGSTGALGIDLVAWNAQTSGNTADPQQLRLGFRAVAKGALGQFTWLAELLTFDWPADGAGTASLMAGQHAVVKIVPPGPAETVAGIGLRAGALQAAMDWVPGAAARWTATVEDVALDVGGGQSVALGTVAFPWSGPFDISDPATLASALGVSIADLEVALRGLVSRAALQWGGTAGFVLAGLLGMHGTLPGWQNDWPSLSDPGASGSLFADPLGAIQRWFARAASETSADGTPFLPRLLEWLRAFITGALPPISSGREPAFVEETTGSGTYSDPWALSLGEGVSAGPALLVWLDSSGPPPIWAAPLAVRAVAANDYATLVRVVQELAAFVPELRSVTGVMNVGTGTDALSALHTYLATSDGIVPTGAQAPDGGGWTVGATVDASHDRVPAAPSAITQVHAQIDAWAGGAAGTRAVLLIGPSFLDHTEWDPLLQDPARHGTIDPSAAFSLRVNGVDPTSISLSGVSSVADYYTADLADDGTGNVAALTTQIAHVVSRINALRPGVLVTIVAHSTAGIAARAFTGLNPALVQGLITLGTPHQGSPLSYLWDARLGDAVRLLQALMPGIAASSLRDAIAHLVFVHDGYAPSLTMGALPVPIPYPVAAFAADVSADTGGRPALAIPATISGRLFDSLGPAIASVATTAARATPPPVPTHVGLGLRAPLGLPAPSVATDIAVSASVRLNALRLPLGAAAQAPKPVVPNLSIDVTLTRPAGWLVGGSHVFAGVGAPLADVRARWAELGVDVELADGAAFATPRLALHQVSYHGPLVMAVAGTDPSAQAVLGAIFQTASATPPASDSALGVLLEFFDALGVTTPDPHGGLGVSADAFAAIFADAASFLGPRLKGAIAKSASALGFAGPTDGPWTIALDGRLELQIAASPWSISVQTTASGLPLTLGPTAFLEFRAAVALPTFVPSYSASLSSGRLTFAWDGAALSVQGAPWFSAPLPLVPAPSSSALTAALNTILPRLLFSTVAGGVIEAALGPGIPVGPIEEFFAASGAWLARPQALGRGDGHFDPERLAFLLRSIGRGAGAPDSTGLALPGGLLLDVTGSGTDEDPVALRLTTTTPLGGIADVSVSLAIDRLLHTTSSGAIALHLALPGSWGQTTVALSLAQGGPLTAIVTPTGVGQIQLLPTFSGLGTLAGAAAALLPRALDAVVAEFGSLGATALLPLGLKVATALDLYDASGGFSAHAAQWRAVGQAGWLASVPVAMRSTGAAAIAALFAVGSPLTGGVFAGIANSGTSVSWTLALGGSDRGTLTAVFGWDGSGPTIAIRASDLKLGSGAVAVSFSAGFANGTTECLVRLGATLQAALGVDVTPTLVVQVDGTGLTLTLLPLATAGGDGPLVVSLAPSLAVTAGPDTAGQVSAHWLLPLVADLLVNATAGSQESILLGAKLKDMLVAAGIVTSQLTTNSSLPSAGKMLFGLLTAVNGGSVKLVSGVEPGDALTLGIVADAQQGLGLALGGRLAITDGPPAVSILFGVPAGYKGPNEGLVLGLFDSSGKFRPGLRAAGVGARFAGANGGPLVNSSQFRLGAIDGYLFFDAELATGVVVNDIGAGAELEGLGLPLGQALGGSVGGNPVAASLLRSDAGGSGSGDANPVNPPVDLSVWYTPAEEFNIFCSGQLGPFWLPIHRGFGPIYIAQIGLELTVGSSTPSAELLIDGSATVAGMKAELDELGIVIPIKSLLKPSDWSLDLKGLALSLNEPGVTMAGGLIKSPGPPVEYDGMILIQIAEFGFVAVGAYSQPKDATGDYTSLFIFAGIFIVIGLPPVIEITGVGLGFGYNRELLPPTDLNQVDDFVLVAALDSGGAFANDPMGELLKIRGQMPARRGSYWFAAGLRGNMFVIVHATAVLYVALDRGFEIGIIGVARMALPSDDTALVSIELALKARFSTAEGVFSIQAQLTDNSWLLSSDCQLTGGFAFYTCFPRSEFVLTLGGYHPAFQKPPEFPEVPRLGYHWSLWGMVNIKGESYFALTSSAVMAGARLEASYGPSCIRVWFTTYTDFLVSWDPFHYDISLGVSIGASLAIDLGFVSIDLTLSIGASLHVWGPALHGEVTVDLGVTSVTVAFGPTPREPPNYVDWDHFTLKYLYGGDPNGYAVAAHVVAGLCPPEPSNAQPSPGTADQPWRISSEFSFQTESRMPAAQYGDFTSNTDQSPPDVHAIDIAPMGPSSVASVHRVALEGWDEINQAWAGVTPTARDPFTLRADHFEVTAVIVQVPEATWASPDPANVPASAHTLPVIGGLRIDGNARSTGQSALIPISSLYDATNPRPLPFAANADIGQLQDWGNQAEALAAVTGPLSTAATFGAARSVLAGAGPFSQARVASGAMAAGLGPLSQRSLATGRSAPPVIAPLSTGLSMKSPALARPPSMASIARALPVPLDQPRLRAVMQTRPRPVQDAPAALRTTVRTIAAAVGAQRVAVSVPTPVVGARLITVRAPTAARATGLASGSRTVKTAETGWSQGPAQRRAFGDAEAALLADGVTLPAGTTHLWDLPSGQFSAAILGNAAVRVTSLGAGGTILSDCEYPNGTVDALHLPAGTRLLAVTCLGRAALGLSVSAGFGAVSAASAPPGAVAATGWQSDDVITQVGASTLLVRGGCVLLARPVVLERSSQRTAQSTVRAADMLARSGGACETWLPATTQTVIVFLDAQDPSAAAGDDLSLAVRGGTLATPPLRVVGGRRKALLYDVTAIDESVGHLVVAVASRSGWLPTGVVGVAGSAAEWAARMNGSIPEALVPEGPLSVDGNVKVRLLRARAA